MCIFIFNNFYHDEPLTEDGPNETTLMQAMINTADEKYSFDVLSLSVSTLLYISLQRMIEKNEHTFWISEINYFVDFARISYFSFVHTVSLKLSGSITVPGSIPRVPYSTG